MFEIALLSTNKNTALVLGRFLELTQHLVTVLPMSYQSVEELQKKLPEVLLFLIEEESEDDLSLLYLLRKDPLLGHLPMLVLVEDFSPERYRKMVEIGVDDILIQPYGHADVLRALTSRMQRLCRFQKKGLCLNENQALREGGRSVSFRKERSVINTYREKDVLFSEGNRPQYIYYLHKGKVKSFKRDRGGKELTVQLYGPGDFIGYIASLEEQPYSISASVLEEAKVELISMQSFRERVRNDEVFALNMIRILEEHNSQKAERMVSLAYHSLRKRVAKSLLFLKGKYMDRGSNEVFSIAIPREELANLAGTTTESLIRTLSDFKDRGWIRIDGRAIAILEEEALQDLRR